jgi:tetratricopeptide (TPR) repeat protein
LAYLADYSAMIGDRQAAMQYLEKALKIAPRNGEVLFRAAIVHHHFHETGQALSYLAKAANAGYSRTVIRDTPDFGDLQQEPQFRSLTSSF